MLDFSLAIAAVLAILAVGYLLTALLFGNATLPLAEMIAVSFGLGTGLLFLELFIASCLGFHLDGKIPVALTLADLLALSLFAGKRVAIHLKHFQVHLNFTLGWIEILFVIVILSSTLLILADALVLPINSWDAVSIWSFKAKILFKEPLRASGYFTDPSKSYSHPDYPLMVPAVQTYIYSVLGHIDDRLVRIVFPAYFLGLLLSLYSFARKSVSRRFALFFTALLASLPPFIGETASGYADVPLAFYYSLMAGYLYLWIKDRRPRYVTLSAIFTALTIFTKNEGIGLSLINLAVLCLFVVLNSEKDNVMRALQYITCSVSLILPWLIFKRGITVIQEDYLTQLSLGNIFSHLDRLPVILTAFFRECARLTTWNVLWYLLGAVSIMGFAHLRRRPLFYLYLLLVLHLSLYCIIYVITPWDVTQLLGFTLTRLFIHVTPVAVYLSAEQIQSLGLERSRST